MNGHENLNYLSAFLECLVSARQSSMSMLINEETPAFRLLKT